HSRRSPLLIFSVTSAPRDLLSFPTRRSSDLEGYQRAHQGKGSGLHHRSERIRQEHVSALFEPAGADHFGPGGGGRPRSDRFQDRSEEHTSELQSRENLVCRLLLEKKKAQPNQ